MRHDLTLAGPAFRLRPVTEADAEFIVALRNQPALSRWLHAGAATAGQQREWLRRYEQREGDWYFVVERLATGAPEGLIGIYDLGADGDPQAAEWGRWILQPGSLAAIESAWLVYRAAFELLGLDALYCRTVAANAAVVSFHDSCGIANRCLLPGQFELHGERFDAIEHRVRRDTDWPALSERLQKLATMTARRLNRG